MNTQALICKLKCRSLWYLAHGFTAQAEKNVLSVRARQCLLKYNSKGVQTERIISPIQLKQLFVPFAILFTGYAMATIAFIFELIVHKRSKRQTAVDDPHPNFKIVLMKILSFPFVATQNAT